MLFWFAIIAVAFYLLYKWMTANNDYFEKRGVAFIEPMSLIALIYNVIFNQMSMPDLVDKVYNNSRVKNEK
jgi:hypothetical protein